MASSPRIVWEASVGTIQSRNNILFGPSGLYVGTCGEFWNRRDGQDGVFRLDPLTGDQVWFSPTTSDVNEIALAGDAVLAPTDAGDLFVFGSGTGRTINVFRLDSQVLARPLVKRGRGGWEALIISSSGWVYELREGSEQIHKVGDVGRPIRGNPVPDGKGAVILTSEDGAICRLLRDPNGYFECSVISEIGYNGYSATESLDPTEVASLSSAVTVDNDSAYVTYARNTMYASPPLVCIDLNTGSERWRANGRGDEDYGNGRTSPLVLSDLVVASFAYSDSLHVFDKHTGALVKKIVVGQSTFQQWSSPLFLGEDRVALGRVDGVLSVVDIKKGKLVASFSLATPEAEKLSYSDLGFESNFYQLGPGEPPSGGICGTPGWYAGLLVAGTTAGRLVAVSL